jgi:hypothetical protein
MWERCDSYRCGACGTVCLIMLVIIWVQTSNKEVAQFMFPCVTLLPT